LPCATYTPAQALDAVEAVRRATSRPINLNFFCHVPPQPNPARAMAWRARLAPYYVELGLDPEAAPAAAGRNPFDDAACRLVDEYRPEVVSFHFGLPDPALLERVKATPCRRIGARWSG
jgi:nitronate monooxygenase